MQRKKKSTKVAGVAVQSKPRKKNPPRTAYSKANPSPYAFKPGENGHTGGTPKRDALLSRSLRVALSERAPDEVCQALHIPTHSSWSQCLARKLLHQAIRGDMQAFSQICAITEVSRIQASFDFPDPSAVPPLYQICFVESDGAGHPAPATIDAKTAVVPAALPPPTEQ